MRLYNTLTRNVSQLVPLTPGRLNVFVCGPTVYDYVHVGNAKTYTQSDMLVRYLRFRGYDVTYLQNITDIDDKIIARAAEQGVDYSELAKKFTEGYFEDMQRLGNTAVTRYAKATDYIADIIRQVQTLIDKGHAYTTSDGIYFEIATFKEYGKLSGRQDIAADDAQTRIDESDEKRGWNDFCLWKFSKPDEPSWDAPFGSGRPGWHIEDTAITEHFFGPQYDIHGGAIDLIFPHHEAELTQMESASGKVPFVGHWFHVGFLTIDDKRMGKSVGNFVRLRDIFEKGYSPATLRLFFLQSHYRKGLNFSYENLDAAANRLQNWRDAACVRWQPSDTAYDYSEDIAQALQSITAALDEDFNTPQALLSIERVFTAVADGIHPNATKIFSSFIQTIDAITNLSLAESTTDIDETVRALLRSRDDARRNKDWSGADQLRSELAAHNITVRDTKAGQLWSRTA